MNKNGINQANSNVGVYQVDLSSMINNNDYLKRVESTGSTGPTLVSGAFSDFTKSKLKIS